jgi:3-deoxy-manno-octulosonate cytidylyltransferase (CMP-KDO synthetase)
MTRATAIIPARLGSTRFPRKALADETGRPMVVHVCERAALAERVGRVVVATDAEEIAVAVRAHGFEAVLTGEHENGTSRVAEAAARLGLSGRDEIVNVQGDEPEIEPGLIDAALLSLGVRLGSPWEVEGAPRPVNGTHAAVGTVAAPFREGEDPSNPNIVKAVVGLVEPRSGVGPGLYFTRAAVPFVRDGSARVGPLKHIGLYAYSVASLRGYLALASTPLERCECLEQLRWLEHGLPIAVAVREAAHHGVDTPEQYAQFVKRWRGV